MTRAEFISRLRRGLGGLPAATIDEIVADHEAHFDEAVAAGRNETEVAAALRNTPAVCRRAYIDPRVFAGWEDGRLARAAAKARGPRQWEQAAARFLRRAGRG